MEEQHSSDAVVLYEEDTLILYGYHNKPLYVTTFVHDVELRQALVKLMSLNLMPLSTLEAAEIPRDRVVEQLIEVSGFGGIHHLHLVTSTLI